MLSKREFIYEHDLFEVSIDPRSPIPELMFRMWDHDYNDATSEYLTLSDVATLRDKLTQWINKQTAV